MKKLTPNNHAVSALMGSMILVAILATMAIAAYVLLTDSPEPQQSFTMEATANENKDYIQILSISDNMNWDEIYFKANMPGIKYEINNGLITGDVGTDKTLINSNERIPGHAKIQFYTTDPNYKGEPWTVNIFHGETNQLLYKYTFHNIAECE